MNRASAKIAAIVAMKGHSARVPGKNIRPLCGKPLFHWIVEALLHVPEIDRVVVETDSDRIAEDAAQSFPVTVLRRPPELYGDHITSNELLPFHMSQIKADVYLQTHSTNPLLRAETMSRAIAAWRGAPDRDSLFTVTELYTRLYWPGGRAINHNPEKLISTQDLPPVLEENSCLYIFTEEGFHARHRRIGLNPILFTTDRLESADIDEEWDFAFAEYLMQRRLAAESTA